MSLTFCKQTADFFCCLLYKTKNITLHQAESADSKYFVPFITSKILILCCFDFTILFLNLILLCLIFSISIFSLFILYIFLTFLVDSLIKSVLLVDLILTGIYIKYSKSLQYFSKNMKSHSRLKMEK